MLSDGVGADRPVAIAPMRSGAVITSEDPFSDDALLAVEFMVDGPLSPVRRWSYARRQRAVP